MSWLGGSISSLTGQLTNLTKDILTEGTEEVSDHATELRIAQEKIKECQTVITSQNTENKRLKRLNHELEEKAEAAELQINSISREYRILLEEKEKEINNLKQLHNEATQHHLKPSSYNDAENEDTMSQSYHRAERNNAGYHGQQFSGDHLDFSDNINMQHEINRLTQEIKKLRAECKHWKTVATDRTQGETTERKPDSSSEVVDLQNKIKELNEQRNNDKEQHQHEIASLQDVHSQKLAALRKKLKSDTTELKQKITDLESQLQSGNTDQVKDDSEHLQTIVQLQSQLQSLEQVKTQVENDNEKLMESLNAMKEEMGKLKDERTGHLSQIDNLTQQVQMYKTDLNKKEEEMSALQKDYDQQQSLKSSLSELEKDYERTSSETEQIVKDLGDSEHQKLTGDIMDSFERENLILKKKNVELQEQVVLLERAVHTITEERQTCERKITDMQQQLKSLRSTDKPSKQDNSDEIQAENQSDVQTVTSDLSELSRQNEELDRQVHVLQEQISKYEQEIDQFEVIKSDWQNEKEALEEVLLQLREQLREKEMSLNVVEAQKGLMEVERQGKKKHTKKDKTKHAGNEEKGLLELEKHEYERSSSDCSSDSDDTIDSTDGDIGADIQKLDHKVELLTQANAELEIERDILLSEKASLEEELLSFKAADTKVTDIEDTSELKQQIKEKDECIATLALEKESLEKSIREFKDIQRQLDLKDRIIAEISQEKNEIEESLEELDNQHQEAMAQLIQIRDNLNKKVESLSHELDDKEDQIKTLLQENEILKTSVQSDIESKHSDDMEQELSNLKDKIVEFENNAKTLEKTVSDLREDVKKKDTDILDLQDKLHKGAVVVNDLHMDKQELEHELNKYKDQISDKVQKLKEIRSRSSELETVIAESNQKIESLEKVNESLEQQMNSQGSIGKSEVEQLQKQIDENLDMSTKAKEKVNEMEEKLKSSDEKYKEAMKKNEDLKSKLSNLQQQLVNIRDLQEKQFSDSNEEFESRITQLQSEKSSLERDVNQLEQTLQSKVKHYENYIQELQKSKEMDSNTVQQEHQQLMQVSHEKDLKITQLESEISTLQSYLEETEDNFQSLVNKQKEIKASLTEKDEEIQKLNNRITVLTEEINGHLSKIAEQDSHLENMQEIQNSLTEIQDENQSLKSEIDDLNRSLQESSDREEMKARSLEVLPDLELELKRSNSKLEELSQELKQREKIIKDHESGISELNQRHQEQNKKLSEKSEKLESQEDLIAVLQQNTREKDQEIILLKNKLQRATSLVEIDKQQLLDDSEEIHPNFSLQAIEYTEKGELELKEVQIEGIKRIEANQLGSENKKIVDVNEELEQELLVEKDENVMQEMEQLQNLLKEKDGVIGELQNNNKSLLKMLESKSKSLLADKSLVDVHQLENEVSSLKLEREQIMAVMNEKSRECSNLKSEVHRLMNVISAEKVALEKLQKDNHELTQKRENSMDDMQREALQNLSRLVRDKDLEIDALTQKNQTLLLMLQETSSGGSGGSTEVMGLMQDKDNLSKQLTALQNEHEQLISCVNQKHQESVAYHGEIQRLTAFMNSEKEKYEETHQNYENLVRQFEDKKQTLLKTQNELINYKQKFTELEIKHGELLQQSNASETVDVASYNAKLEEIKRLQEKQKEHSDSNKEKEMKIQSLHQQNIEYEEILANRDLELSNQKKQVDNLTFQLHGVQSELVDIKNEHLSNDQQISEKISQIQMMKEANDRLTLTLQEREFELKSLKEKVETLTAVVQDREGEKGSVDKLMKENETVMLQAKHLQQERDQALMAIKQRLVENEELSREIQKLKEKENKSSRELDRLRNHLIQMEESYTREALDAEEREKELRNRLVIAEEKILSSSSEAESANQHASEQVENLQQQLYAVAGQRDQAYLQYGTLQDQCQQYASSLANLQMVLEQFQQEKENQVAVEVEHFQKEAQTLEGEVTRLREELEETKRKLEDAEDGLEAAHRLSEQLDKREEAILALKEEVQLREKALKDAEDKLKALVTSQDNKVDKLVIKNLFMGYFTTPKGQKHQVLVAIGGVLNFSREDFEKIEGTGGGWVPGFLRFGSKPSTPSTPYFTPPHTPISTPRSTPQVNKSFSELFVKFLETESTPPPPAVKLPAEEMARDVQRQRETNKPAYNPFTAPRHVAMPLKIGEPETSQGSAILMSTAPLSPTLPLFTPLSANEVSHSPSSSGRSTPNTSSAILKDVLGAR